MNELIKALTNININSESAVEIARLWFWKEIIQDLITASIVLIIVTIVIIAIHLSVKYNW